MKRTVLGYVVITIGIMTLQVASSAQQTYSVISLGDLGGQSATPSGINDRMQIVGTAPLAEGPSRAFLWDNGTMTNLGVLPGHFSSTAEDINNRGEVVGASGTVDGLTIAAVLWRDGVAHDLGTLGGNYGQAFAINNRGDIVGASADPTGVRATLWSADGSIVNLGSLGGGSQAWDINNRGQVVGFSQTATGEQHAFLWENGAMIDLGTLPGDEGSEAYAINDRGQIVGRSFSVANNTERAFIWEDGVMRELASGNGVAFDVNNRSQAVGDIAGEDLRSRAALFELGEVIQLPLASGDPGFSSANAINSSGAIVGVIGSQAVLWLR